MQLDVEEDESAFYKPPVEPTARTPTDSTTLSSSTATVTPSEEDEEE